MHGILFNRGHNHTAISLLPDAFFQSLKKKHMHITMQLCILHYQAMLIYQESSVHCNPSDLLFLSLCCEILWTTPLQLHSSLSDSWHDTYAIISTPSEASSLAVIILCSKECQHCAHTCVLLPYQDGYRLPIYRILVSHSKHIRIHYRLPLSYIPSNTSTY